MQHYNIAHVSYEIPVPPQIQLWWNLYSVTECERTKRLIRIKVARLSKKK